jgi:tetratricopeptide (TPR) repeat protein
MLNILKYKIISLPQKPKRQVRFVTGTADPLSEAITKIKKLLKSGRKSIRRGDERYRIGERENFFDKAISAFDQVISLTEQLPTPEPIPNSLLQPTPIKTQFLSNAYIERGNAKYLKDDKDGAFVDWLKGKEIYASFADRIIPLQAGIKIEKEGGKLKEEAAAAKYAIAASRYTEAINYFTGKPDLAFFMGVALVKRGNCYSRLEQHAEMIEDYRRSGEYSGSAIFVK